MRILGLAILSLAALIIILIYSYKDRDKKKRILHELWKIAGKTDQIVGMPVRKLRLMEICNIRASDFEVIVTQLTQAGILTDNMDSIEFTEYGKQYYEFTLKPEHAVRG